MKRQHLHHKMKNKKQFLTVFLAALLAFTIIPQRTAAIPVAIVAEGEEGADSENSRDPEDLPDTQLLSLDNTDIVYVLGTRNGLISERKASKVHAEDQSTVTYSFQVDDTDLTGDQQEIYGISADSSTGEVKAADYKRLAGKLAETPEEKLHMIVTAHKDAYPTDPVDANGDDGEFFAAAGASYQITIVFAQVPDHPYQLVDASEKTEKEFSETNKNLVGGWYNKPVTVVPAEGLTVTREMTEAENLGFAPYTVFGADGRDQKVVTDPCIYLRAPDGGIARSSVKEFTGDDPIQIDTMAPQIASMTFAPDDATTIMGRIMNFFRNTVTVTVTGTDAASGMKEVKFTYAPVSDVSQSGHDSVSITKTAKAVVSSDHHSNQYMAAMEIPKDIAGNAQLRGQITAVATDNAGLESPAFKGDERTVIYDADAPEIVKGSVRYSTDPAEAGTNLNQVTEGNSKHNYLSGNAIFSFTLKEANFYPEDYSFRVQKLAADGTASTDTDTFRGNDQNKVTWTDNGDGSYTGSIRLTEEGDYVITISGTDKSGNAMAAYTSDKITIDKTNPVTSIRFSNGTNGSLNAQNAHARKQAVTFTVKDHNFDASQVVVTLDARNIKGEEAEGAYSLEAAVQTYLKEGAHWTKRGDTYTLTLSVDTNPKLVDAIYYMTLNATDLADRSSNNNTEYGPFTIDHTKPSDVTIDYEPTLHSVPWRIINGVTFGFFNEKIEAISQVRVKFTARDITSGIDHFTWSYVKEDGEADAIQNPAQYTNVVIGGSDVQQSDEDKSTFTASVVLPRNVADQLRGSIAVYATDRYAHDGNAPKPDGTRRIVMDSIVPAVSVIYNAPARTIGSTHYYNGAVTATFTVTENNFYAEDVKLYLTKNGERKEIRPAWSESSKSVHVGTYTIGAPEDHSGDGDYIFSMEYTDRSQNAMATYTSDRITIDTIAPVISVTYANTSPANVLTDSENHGRQYFDSIQTATVTVNEHNFDLNEVQWTILAKNVAGNALNANALSTMSSWSDDGDLHTIMITYPGDANYTFDVDYTDQASNAAADRTPDYFTVDTTAPTKLTISYSDAVQDTSEGGAAYRYYKDPVTVTITATDNITGVHHFDYSYLKAAGVSSVNGELANQQIGENGIRYSNDGATATAQFRIPREALTASNQFNGNITFTAADRAENESAVFADNTRIVVDNIAPHANVAFNQPVQNSNGVAYYDGNVTGTVAIADANFHPEDIQTSVTRDGGAYPVAVSWADQSTDIHIGTFTLSEDGDYFVTINGADKSGNRMMTYTSGQMTVDTQIEAPLITVNGENPNGHAYKDDVVAGVSVSDTNFADYTMNLTRTRNYDKDVDVTREFLKGGLTRNGTGGEGTFDTFHKDQDVDGIFTLTVNMRDKAGHTSSSSATFSVNRYGSVYVYSDYLASLIKDGGAYVKKVKDDLQITEYNPDQLVEGSLAVDLSKDGKPVDDASYRADPAVNLGAQPGDSGWYQYTYTIDQDNFKSDGVYKMSVSSRDIAGNYPDTEDSDQGAILFRVDSTAPEISSITGLGQSIMNAPEDHVKYMVFDAIGLKSVKVYRNDRKTVEYTDFNQDPNNFDGSILLKESSNAQKVRLVVEDKAGNITDTDEPEFARAAAYKFFGTVTISTNPFVRLLAWIHSHAGITAGIAAAIVAVLVMIRLLLISMPPFT